MLNKVVCWCFKTTDNLAEMVLLCKETENYHEGPWDCF